MFVDEARIHVKAGNGGNGCVSFRREKGIPKGGPEGGDGGRGGAIIFFADPNKDTLLDFSGRHHWNAKNGAGGMGKKMAGENGEDLTIPVPVGTLIYDADHKLLLADMDAPGKQVTVCKPGRGGRGNWHFKSATNQTPRYAEPGTEGEDRNLFLELKLMADVGLVGMPNAGKSTLLAGISAARPKIAAYPFTTLDPQLGIVELDADRRLVVADIPGVIEGAVHGAGLGIAFLKHIERTKVIVHLIDLFPADGSDPAKNYKTIRKELEGFSKTLGKKTEFIAANKLDLATDDGKALAKFRKAMGKKKIYPISGGTVQGLSPLLEALWKKVASDRVKEAKKAAKLVPDAPVAVPLAFAPGIMVLAEEPLGGATHKNGKRIPPHKRNFGQG
jgi:GTPase